jgi:hypothetical protein
LFVVRQLGRIGKCAIPVPATTRRQRRLPSFTASFFPCADFNAQQSRFVVQIATMLSLPYGKAFTVCIWGFVVRSRSLDSVSASPLVK